MAMSLKYSFHLFLDEDFRSIFEMFFHIWMMKDLNAFAWLKCRKQFDFLKGDNTWEYIK